MTARPMALALAAARAAARRGEVPVGAVVTDPAGRLVAVASNRVEAQADPTAHAEILAIRRACRARGSKWLDGCAIHVTLEPCPMCAQAISLARLRRLYYGAADPKSGGVDSGARVFDAASCHHRPEVYGGIGATEAAALLRGFFRARRS